MTVCVATPEVKPVKLKTALICPALTDRIVLVLPSVMVSVLAKASVNEIVPLTLYWLVVDKHSVGVIAKAKAGTAGVTEQEAGAE
ncbi:hypothetical protein GCM10027341_06020 [Spirosoma knui]